MYFVKYYIYTGEEDISTASVFQDLNSDDIKKLKLSSGGRIRVRKWLHEIKTGCK